MRKIRNLILVLIATAMGACVYSPNDDFQAKFGAEVAQKAKVEQLNLTMSYVNLLSQVSVWYSVGNDTTVQMYLENIFFKGAKPQVNGNTISVRYDEDKIVYFSHNDRTIQDEGAVWKINRGNPESQFTILVVNEERNNWSVEMSDIKRSSKLNLKVEHLGVDRYFVESGNGLMKYSFANSPVESFEYTVDQLYFYPHHYNYSEKDPYLSWGYSHFNLYSSDGEKVGEVDANFSSRDQPHPAPRFSFDEWQCDGEYKTTIEYCGSIDDFCYDY